MDFSWANDDFMRQIAAIATGAVLSALTAVIIFGLTALKDHLTREKNRRREHELRMHEWWSARVAEFENELISYLPTLSEWKRGQTYTKAKSVADYDELMTLVADRSPGELDSSRLPKIIQSSVFADLERVLATLQIKAPSETIRKAVDEARRHLGLYRASVAMGIYVTEKSTKKPQDQVVELDTRLKAAVEALDEIVRLHSQTVDKIAGTTE